jgi:hypothetical protein
MNKKTTTDPEIAAISRALRRAAKRAMRLAKATRTPFWVMKNGRIVNLNPDAKGGRKVRPAATKAGRGAKELQARVQKAKKGGRKSGSQLSVGNRAIPSDKMK